MGRNTQGVRLVSLDEGDEVVDVARIMSDLDADPEDVVQDGDSNPDQIVTLGNLVDLMGD